MPHRGDKELRHSWALLPLFSREEPQDSFHLADTIVVSTPPQALSKEGPWGWGALFIWHLTKAIGAPFRNI